jgi:hypothetical protein
VRLVRRHWPPALVFTGLQALLVGLTPRFPMLLVLLLAFGLCCSYVIYRNLHADCDAVD